MVRLLRELVFFKAYDSDTNRMPLPYSPKARDLMSKFKKKGWAYEPLSGYEPYNPVIWCSVGGKRTLGSGIHT